MGKYRVKNYQVVLKDQKQEGPYPTGYMAINCEIEGEGAAEDLSIHFVRPDLIRDYNLEDDLIQVWVPEDRYPWYLDLLRNEGPIWVQVQPAAVYGQNVVRLTTSQEPTGEGEI